MRGRDPIWEAPSGSLRRSRSPADTPTGVAVFGLLGLLAATLARTRAERVAAICAGFAVGALIGVSRVVLGVHYVTDVLAGAFLGLAWLVACLVVVQRLRR